jgi:NADH dehydrogenase FAD-containing subunit
MQIVIVGGGFAGVKAALELSKRKVGHITLISDEPYFLHHATLYATATGRSTAESVIPLIELFQGYDNVTVVQDKMQSIDTDRKLVVGKKGHYEYDNLIIAIGSVTTFFGINGMQKHAYGIKSLGEIKSFRNHIKSEVENGSLDKNYVIIGAGPTGVELAGALCVYLHKLVSTHKLKHSRVSVTIVEAAPRILPKSSETASKIVSTRLKKMGIKVLTNHRVEALDGDYITVDKKKISTETAIWTSGVANNPFFAKHDHLFQLAPNGRINVNRYLQASPNIFVLGDNNTVKFSGMAWPALAQATFIAKHLNRISKKHPLWAFHPTSPPSGLPVGEKWGYVEWHGVYVAGRFGYMCRRWMELYGYCQLTSLPNAVRLWRAHDISDVDV